GQPDDVVNETIQTTTPGDNVKTNYVLIDFENVQPESLELFNHDHFKVIVFVGAKQGGLKTNIVISVQKLGARAEYIEISGHGSNALDFHIAYYIGRLAVEARSAQFHIISRDKGFDPLIQHLKSKNIRAERVEQVSDIFSPSPPIAKPVTTESSEPVDDKFTRLVAVLKKQPGKSRPRKEKTLKSSIAALFKKKGEKSLPDSELNRLFNKLKSTGKIKVDGTSVTYHL
ncbi:MAG TPA: PIN domain-containing protein, partial [Planctomycetaceae bacterium]|nr:PIN domain-containing protein [Planctomycetaceae bacterium]